MCGRGRNGLGALVGALLRRVCFVAALLLLGAPLHAAQGDNAEELFKAGVAAARAGRWEEAISSFRASYQADPSRGTLQGLAMAEEKAGKLVAALGHYQGLEREAREAKDKERAEFATARIRELEPRVPKLTVAAKAPLPAGTVVELDGRVLGDAELGVATLVDPGEHTISAKTRSGASFRSDVRLVEASSSVVEVTFESPSAPPEPREKPRGEEPPRRPLRTVGLVVGAVGLAAAALGAYLWVDAGSQYDDLRDKCPNGQCSSSLQSDIDAGRRKETLGQVALVGGGILIAAGATLFVVGSKKPAEPAVALGVRPGGVLLFGRFGGP